MGLIKKIVVTTVLSTMGLGCSLFDDDRLDVEHHSASLSVLQNIEERKEAREESLKKRLLERQKRDEERKLEQAIREKEWQEKVERETAEQQKRLEEWKAQQKENPPKKRQVRRFKWESPAKARGRLWNVPKEESEHSVLNAFLRVCIAEADGILQDCVGIWQVVSNIRQRSCNREMVRKITECQAGEDGQETTLSAFRRAQKHVLGMIKPRNARVRWISNINTECEPPKNWPHSEAKWDSQYASRCQHIVELGRHLIKGELPPHRPGVPLRWLPGRPIAWGGKCESGKASCDDQIACARGLVRIPGNIDTTNAFWCVSGRGACRKGIDPVCEAFGDKFKEDRERVEKKLRKKRIPIVDEHVEVSQRTEVSTPQS